MNVLVLGHKGMLGHIVCKYLTIKGIRVYTCDSRWPSKNLKVFLKKSNYDFIVNCIGAIPQRKNKFSVNYKLPIWLDTNTSSKIIHQGTDYNSNDNYGVSKQKAVDFILNKGTNTKILKTAIIGPELNSKASLLEWFLSQESEVDGYTKAIWSGNTTLEWAKHCYNLIMDWDLYSIETTLKGETISKYGLLKVIADVWNKKININKVVKGTDRSLTEGIITPDIKTQLLELKNLLNENNGRHTP